MLSRGRSCGCAFLLAVAALQLHAQEDMPAPGRGARGNVRAFLGLGPPPDAAAAARGEKLFNPNCEFCHGERARGASGPNLVRSQVVLDDEKGEAIGAVVAEGRPDKGMPAFPAFTKDQLYDLAEYLHMQVELVANRGSYKRLNIVTGNAQAGEAYFNGAGGCSACHSVAGDLAHIGGKFQPDQLQNQFVWPGGRGFGGGRGAAPAEKVTVTLPSGQSVTGTLRRIDDFNVSIRDSAGDYHSWPREAVRVQIEDRLAAHRQLLAKYTDADIHNLTAYLVTLK